MSVLTSYYGGPHVKSLLAYPLARCFEATTETQYMLNGSPGAGAQRGLWRSKPSSSGLWPATSLRTILLHSIEVRKIPQSKEGAEGLVGATPAVRICCDVGRYRADSPLESRGQLIRGIRTAIHASVLRTRPRYEKPGETLCSDESCKVPVRPP